MDTFHQKKFEVGLFLAISKITRTLRGTALKRASTFWHRFVAILRNKTAVPETLKIEREMKFDSFETGAIMGGDRKRDIHAPNDIFRTGSHARMRGFSRRCCRSCVYHVSRE